MFKQLILGVGLSSLLAGAGLGVGVGAGTAAAAPLIPDGATGSITVHKFEQPVEYGPDAMGMELPASVTAGYMPLAGAEFTLKNVDGINLSTNAGFVAAEKVVQKFDPFNPAQSINAAGHNLGSAKTETTNEKGQALFAELPVGLYLVEETRLPGVAENQAVTKAMPFLIMVPLTDPAGLQNWVYDVHVYPKNVISEVCKTVEDKAAIRLGDQVKYQVESSIPGGSVTTKFVITDTIDSRLTYQSAKVFISGVEVTDVILTPPAAPGGNLVVTLGESARGQAFAALQADPNAKVKVEINVLGKESGEIDNQAKVTFQRAGENVTEVLSNRVVTKFGGIKILKVSTANVMLPGAVFEVWASKTNDFKTAAKVSINGTDSWTTPASGEITIDGLRYSAFADGSAVTSSSGKYNHYWLVETKAPKGYELLAKPVPFTVGSQVGTVPVLSVVNTPHNAGGKLPLTGGSGSLAAIGVGLALAGAGAFFLTRRSRPSSRD